MNKFRLLLSFILILLPTLPFASPRKSIIPVVVSISPQKYFVEQIAGPRAKATLMVPKGFEPEDYEPYPQQLKALTHAKLYFAIDIPFETHWLKKFQQINPAMKIVFTNQGIEKMEMSSGHHHHHGFSSLLIKDPHIWLSPKLVKLQAMHIRNAFIEVDPQHANFYRQNYQQFIHKINSLNGTITALFEKKTDKKKSIFFIFHPSLGYFARDYGLIQIPVEREGKTPTLKQLSALVKLAKNNHIKTIFISPEFSPREAEVIAKAIGGKTKLIDPLAENWLDNMKHIAIAISESLHHE